MTFACLDFETANLSDASICAAGMAVVEDGKVVESSHWLVRPPKGHGWFREDFTDVHGLTWFGVQDAPEFPAVLPEILARLARADIVVAHHAAFDMRMLRGTLQHFGLVCPKFDYACTMKLSRRVWPDLPSHGLKVVETHLGHEFEHHHAQADTEAAGRIMVAMMEQTNARSPRELLHATGVEAERFGL